MAGRLTLGQSRTSIVGMIDLRSERLKRQLSLTAVAEQTGIDITHLSRVENGKRKLTPHQAMELANLYGLPFEKLIFVNRQPA